MQLERSGLVPIGEAVSGLDDELVPALRDASPQARHHFTVADQVNQLVAASEADPERGFMARTMALCSLPRSSPGNRKEYKRVNGPFTLGMSAGLDNKLPFGNYPRLLMAWLCTEAVRTQSRVLVLGPSLAKFMKTLGRSPQSNAAVRLHCDVDRRGSAPIAPRSGGAAQIKEIIRHPVPIDRPHSPHDPQSGNANRLFGCGR